jgi:hypothetical protein
LNRLRLASAAALVAIGLSGCASTSVTQLWRDPAYRSHPGQRVFVVAAIPGSANPAQFESALARELNAKGFQATTRSSVFPGGHLARIQVQEYVKSNSIDLLIMERLTTEAAAPTSVTTTVVQSNGWYGAYGGVAASSTVVSQGTDVIAKIEVYDVRTEPDALVWSGESNAIDIQGAPQSLAAVLTSELVKAQVLVK